MALETLADLQTSVMEPLGLDPRTHERIVNEAINDAARHFHLEHSWGYRRAHAYFTTVAPYTTGTVAVTNGSTTVTGTGTTFTAAMVGRKFSLAVGYPWYEIGAFVSTTEVTLSRAYEGTTGSTLSYTIWEDTYTLSSAAYAVQGKQMTLHEESGYRIGNVTELDLDDLYPIPRSQGKPAAFAMTDEDTSTTPSSIQVRLGPASPDAAYQVRYGYLTDYTEMEDSSDTPAIPARWLDIIVIGATSRVLSKLPQFAGSNRAESKQVEFMRRMHAATKKEARVRPRVWRLKAFDEVTRSDSYTFHTPVD